MPAHIFSDFATVSTAAMPPKNEDATYISDTVVAVADGATGLHPDLFVMRRKRSNPRSDADWFAKDLALRFGSDLEFSLRNVTVDSTRTDSSAQQINSHEILMSALDEMERDYLSEATSQGIEDKIRAAGISCLPSAAMHTAYIEGENLVMEALGDCPAIVKMRSGEYHVLSGDGQLGILDAQAKAFINAYAREHDMTPREARQGDAVMGELRRIRTHMNSGAPDGYSIASFHNKENIRVIRRVFDAARVEGVLLMSDGFYQLVDTFGVLSNEELYNQCSKTSPMLIEKTLRQCQRDDADCEQYPRTKVGDDATAVFVHIH